MACVWECAVPLVPGLGTEIIGDPDRIRTCDPQIRNLMLYPAELRGRVRAVGQTWGRCGRKTIVFKRNLRKAGVLGASTQTAERWLSHISNPLNFQS